MLRGPLFRLLALPLIALILSGGGGFPVLDGVIFHSQDRGPDSLRPHYEATSGCHADVCAVRSTAHLARLIPTVPAALELLFTPEHAGPGLRAPVLLASPLTGQPHSRAPPLFG